MFIIPYGYCHCGCGKKTELAKRDNKKYGIKIGQPNYFLNGHGNKWQSRSIEQRFWAKVVKKGKNECWPWIGSKDPRGYGHFWTGNRETGAHRASWVIHFGPISNDILILHHCDNPNCVNPKHLFRGTPKDNMIDMVKKGRAPNSNAKLTRNQVDVIRSLHGKFKNRELAKMFNVSIPLIEKIIGNKIWRVHKLSENTIVPAS